MAGIPILMIQQTMLLVAALALRALLPRVAHWRHIMLVWYVVLLRLAFPFPLPDPLSSICHPSAPTSYVPQATPTSSFALACADWFETDAGRAALCIWAAVAMALLAYQGASLHRWKRSHTQLGPVDDPNILACAASYWHSPKHSPATRAKLLLGKLLGDAGPLPQSKRSRRKACTPDAGAAQGVRLMWCESVTAPVVFGCAHPVVLIPPDIAHCSRQAKCHAIEHELTHVRWQDAFFKLAFTCVCCLLWFNPLVWIARRLALRDTELACDEEVTRFGSQGERRAYAELLLEFAQPTRAGMCQTWVSHFSSGHAAFLAVRLKALKATMVESGMSSLIVCAMASCLALAVCATGPASNNNPWVVKTELGSITLPQAWRGQVEVSVLRTANGTEVAFVYPLGEPSRPILGFGSLDELPGDDADSATTLVAVTSYNGYSCALWGYACGTSGQAAGQPGSNKLVNSIQAAVTGGSDMDSLGFLKRTVVPTFCAE